MEGWKDTRANRITLYQGTGPDAMRLALSDYGAGTPRPSFAATFLHVKAHYSRNPRNLFAIMVEIIEALDSREMRDEPEPELGLHTTLVQRSSRVPYHVNLARPIARMSLCVVTKV